MGWTRPAQDQRKSRDVEHTMTSARIKAIRFFLKETPMEFANRINAHVMDTVLWESGHKEPDGVELDALVKAELTLNLKGITTEKIDEREDRYNK